MLKPQYQLLIFVLLSLFLLQSCSDDPLCNCPCFKDPQYPIYKGCGDDVEYNSVDACASVQALYKLIYDNIKYPAEAREDSVQGTVKVEFDIQKDGHMTNITVVNDTLGYGLAEEAIRVVHLMNDKGWCPARVDCEPIVFHFTFPIKYVLQ